MIRTVKNYYPVLRATMAFSGVTVNAITKATGIQYRTFQRRLNGECDWPLRDCIAVKEFLGVNLPVEVLFEKENE